MEFLAYFFSVHIDFNTQITGDETVFIIHGNYCEYFSDLIDLAQKTGAEHCVTENKYLIIKTKQTYKISIQFDKLGY